MHENEWVIAWPDRDNRTRRLLFELDRGYRYFVIAHSEQDKTRFLDLFLRPPETAIISGDGGLLNNICTDENLLLPVSYHGLLKPSTRQHIAGLLSECGLDENESRELLAKLPIHLSAYQKRLAGFVRSALMNPRVMVYDSILEGIFQAEKEKIRLFDDVYRRYSPTHTAVYLDYDTHSDRSLHAEQTFIL